MEKITLSLLLENVGADVRVDYYSAAKAVKPSSFSFHSHTTYEVYFIDNGEMEVCVGEQTIHLRRRHVLILSPNTMHCVKRCSDACRRFNLRFLLHTNAETVQIAPCVLFEPPGEVTDEIFADIGSIYRLMPRLHERWAFYRVKSYFGILMSYLLEVLLPAPSESVRIGTEDQSKLERQIRIDSFFGANFARNVTVAHLAKELRYSKTHVNRLLRQDFGMTFSEKLAQTRVQAAKQALRDGEEPIGSIGERCGYSTLRGFELFFKKQTGLLPKEYRKQFRG